MKFSIRDSWERIVEDNRKTYKRHNYEDIHTKIQFSSSIPKREKLMNIRKFEKFKDLRALKLHKIFDSTWKS